MKVSKFVSSFLSAADLASMGPVLIHIESIDEEQVGSDTKPVLRGWGQMSGVGEDGKPECRDVVIALNPTNLVSLTDIFKSDESDEWLGEGIVAFNDPTVMFNNKKTGGIRFRKPKAGFAVPVRPIRVRDGGVKPEDAPF
jgi:hypothetical protein